MQRNIKVQSCQWLGYSYYFTSRKDRWLKTYIIQYNSRLKSQSGLELVANVTLYIRLRLNLARISFGKLYLLLKMIITNKSKSSLRCKLMTEMD